MPEAGLDLQTVQSTTLLNQAGSPGEGCPGPCPPVFLVSLRMEMPQHLWATCTKSLAISAEVAKEMFGVGLFYICNILNSFSFNYLNSIPWNRTCNLARKDLMTRMNSAVPVKIKSSQKGKMGERGLPKFICSSQTFVVVLGIKTCFIQVLEFTSYQEFQKIRRHLKTEGSTLYIHMVFHVHGSMQGKRHWREAAAEPKQGDLSMSLQVGWRDEDG